jgi:hypothetical protein
MILKQRRHRASSPRPRRQVVGWVCRGSQVVCDIMAKATSQPTNQLPRCGLAGRLEDDFAPAARWSVVSWRRRPVSQPFTFLAAASLPGCRLSLPQQPGALWHHGEGDQPANQPASSPRPRCQAAGRMCRDSQVVCDIMAKTTSQPDGPWYHGPKASSQPIDIKPQGVQRP